jgi:hypothetical protein
MFYVLECFECPEYSKFWCDFHAPGIHHTTVSPDSSLTTFSGMECEPLRLHTTDTTHTPSPLHTTVGVNGSVGIVKEMRMSWPHEPLGLHTTDATHTLSPPHTIIGADGSIGNIKEMKISWPPRHFWTLGWFSRLIAVWVQAYFESFEWD